MIGAWCFVDHFGPTEQTDGMVVAAHPHTGLQTVTWLFEGQIEHRDSIGSVQIIRPGQLNLMTAGKGISHSELSQAGPDRLHAVQLWVALPKESIDTAPEFEHQNDLPRFELTDGIEATVLAGKFMEHSARTKTFSPLLGVELKLSPNSGTQIQLDPNFEHGILLADGEISVNAEPVPTSGLFFVPAGAESITILAGKFGATALLLGGQPFGERILMWWNFIGRTHKDIVQARDAWNVRQQKISESRFGEFEDQIGGWIPAPELPSVTLQPR